MRDHDVCCMKGMFAAAAGSWVQCYMSGHRSEVSRPSAAPDSPFPFLDKTGVKKRFKSKTHRQEEACRVTALPGNHQDGQSESEKGLATLH